MTPASARREGGTARLLQGSGLQSSRGRERQAVGSLQRSSAVLKRSGKARLEAPKHTTTTRQQPTTESSGNWASQQWISTQWRGSKVVERLPCTQGRRTIIAVPGGSSTHDLQQTAILGTSSKSFRARRGCAGHAAACQGAAGMRGQGALAGPAAS